MFGEVKRLTIAFAVACVVLCVIALLVSSSVDCEPLKN